MITEIIIALVCVVILCRVSYLKGRKIGYDKGIAFGKVFKGLAEQCDDIANILSKGIVSHKEVNTNKTFINVHRSELAGLLESEGILNPKHTLEVYNASSGDLVEWDNVIKLITSCGVKLKTTDNINYTVVMPK